MAFSELSNPLNGKLKVLTFGAGAIGTYIGGSLALAGHQVVFVEKPAIVDELRDRGLRLDLTLDPRRKTNEAFRITPPSFLIVSSLEDALRYGPFDVSLFALKSYDTLAALEGMKPFADRMPPVLCLSNGVANEPAIAEALGAEQVIYGTVTRKDRSVCSGIYTIVYPVPNVRVTYIPWTWDVPAGYWRSVGQSHNCFFVESFIDELSHAGNEDPLTFRTRLLYKHPRHLKVLQEAAAQADWGKPLAPGCGRGLAISDNHGTIVAEIVKVAVGKEGKLSVEEVICVVNCRQVIHPDTVIAQMEGSILDGLSAALYGQITLTQGQVDQSNFSDYRFLNLAEAPKVTVHLIPESGRPGGIGELGLPPIAPALANAIFDATGRRIRYLPVSKQQFLRV